MAKDVSSSIDFSAFEVAIKVLDASCGAVPSLYVSPNKGFIQLAATLNGSTACFRIPGSIEGLDGPIEVPKDVFLQGVKGRKGGTLSIKNSILVLQSGNYSASINVVSAEENTVPDVPAAAPSSEDVVSFVLTPDLSTTLSTVLPALRIEKVHQFAPEVMIALRVKAKALWAATYDDNQLCFQKAKAESDLGDFSFAAPYTRVLSLIKDLPTSGAKVYVTQDTLTAVSKVFRVSIALPATDPDSMINPASVYEKAQAVSKASGSAISVSREDLQALVENARALVATGSAVKFSPSKKGTTVSISSPRGEVKQVIKTTGSTTPFSIGYGFMQTILQKQKTTKKAEGEESVGPLVDFEVCDNTFVICRSSVTYLALLSVEDNGD